MPEPLDLVRRRTLLAVGGLGALSAACGAVGSVGFGNGTQAEGAAESASGRLVSRPQQAPPGQSPADQTAVPAPAAPALATGAQALGLDSGRDGVLYVPPGLTAPAPLLLLLHGATGSAAGITRRTDALALADELKIVIVAPDSRKTTWDAIRGRFGVDVAFVDRALAVTFARAAIDPTRVAIGGFSDGASYAISLGLLNGDLFTHVAAFSPGFFLADAPRGRPLIFVSHGTRDEVLPIETTSRKVVPALEKAGYTVRYREFDGPHTVPPKLAREAFLWIAGRPGA